MDKQRIECKNCGGNGLLWKEPDEKGSIADECPICKGEGEIDAPDAPPAKADKRQAAEAYAKAQGIPNYETELTLAHLAGQNIARDVQSPTDAVAFAKWLQHIDNGTEHYNPHTKLTSPSIGFSPSDCFNDEIKTPEELYELFKLFNPSGAAPQWIGPEKHSGVDYENESPEARQESGPQAERKGKEEILRGYLKDVKCSEDAYPGIMAAMEEYAQQFTAPAPPAAAGPGSNEGRKKWMRMQATTIFELTKGFTPEQRNAFSNAMNTMEQMAGYVLELTNEIDNPQTPAGPVWVKAPKRVRITKCSYSQGWYKNLIGEEFDVDNAGAGKDYVVWEDYSTKALVWRHISQEDCVSVTASAHAQQVFTREQVEAAYRDGYYRASITKNASDPSQDTFHYMNTNFPPPIK